MIERAIEELDDDVEVGVGPDLTLLARTLEAFDARGDAGLHDLSSETLRELGIGPGRRRSRRDRRAEVREASQRETAFICSRRSETTSPVSGTSI